MRLLVLAVALFGFAGCLSIDTPGGVLFCSSVPNRACPEGYYCLAADNTCWPDGKFPGDMADPAHFPSGGGDDMSIPLGPDDLGPTDDSGSLPD